jgi:hypothetical protein
MALRAAWPHSALLVTGCSRGVRKTVSVAAFRPEGPGQAIVAEGAMSTGERLGFTVVGGIPIRPRSWSGLDCGTDPSCPRRQSAASEAGESGTA